MISYRPAILNDPIQQSNEEKSCYFFLYWIFCWNHSAQSTVIVTRWRDRRLVNNPQRGLTPMNRNAHPIFIHPPFPICDTQNHNQTRPINRSSVFRQRLLIISLHLIHFTLVWSGSIALAHMDTVDVVLNSIFPHYLLLKSSEGLSSDH